VGSTILGPLKTVADRGVLSGHRSTRPGVHRRPHSAQLVQLNHTVGGGSESCGRWCRAEVPIRREFSMPTMLAGQESLREGGSRGCTKRERRCTNVLKVVPLSSIGDMTCTHAMDWNVLRTLISNKTKLLHFECPCMSSLEAIGLSLVISNVECYQMLCPLG